MFVKICGLRTAETAGFAVAHGADAVGVVMSPRSPRHASEAEARSVIEAVKRANGAVDVVLVVREMPAQQAATVARDLGFDVLQLHGGYTRDDFEAARRILPRLWRATSLAGRAGRPPLRAGAFGEERLLVDGANAGSGEVWDLDLLGDAELGDAWLLAGGLHHGNVREAIARAKPAGVDVSSGVESAPGVKDPMLIEQFIAAARS